MMSYPQKPLQRYYTKVEQERVVNTYCLEKMNLEIPEDCIDWTHFAIERNQVTFRKMVEDVDAYQAALVKYEEDLVLYATAKEAEERAQILILEKEVVSLKEKVEKLK